MDARCTVLVASCDKYSDMIGPFARLWRRFWPDCPFGTALLTESAPAAGGPGSGAFGRTIATGGGLAWCEMLLRALEKIETPYVMLLMDDYLLDAPVDTALVLERLGQAEAAGAANLRLIPNPAPSRGNTLPFDGFDGLFRYKPRTAYCVSTQAGFWKRGYLAALAEGRKSAWEFERYGSFDPATQSWGPILAARKREFPFVDSVHKGYWEKAGVENCRRNGIEPDLSRRPLPPLRARLAEAAKAAVFSAFPADWIVKIQNIFGIGAK